MECKDVKKVKTFDQVNQGIIDAENKIKSLTTSTDFGDIVSRGLKSSTQIKYEVVQQQAILGDCGCYHHHPADYGEIRRKVTTNR